MKNQILLILLILTATILQAQTLVNNGSKIIVNSGATIIVSGSYINQSSDATTHGEIESDGTIIVNQNWTNNAISGNVFTNNNSTGDVILNGNILQTIGGTQATNFENLTINNSSTGIELQQNINVAYSLDIQDGDIDIKNKTIDLEDFGELSGETETQRIKATDNTNTEGLGTGYIIARNRDLNNPTNENIAGLGLALTSANNLGNTDVFRGHLKQTSALFNTGESINRYYEITSANPALTTFNLSYFDAELNGNNEDSLIYFIENPSWYINTSTANTQALETTTSDFSKFTIANPIIGTMNGGIINENQSLCFNENPAEFTDSISPSGGYGTWVYKWEYQENCSGNWIAIANTNSLTYNETANLSISRCYRRIAINDYDTAYSNIITVTVFDIPEINIVVGIPICENETLTLNETADEAQTWNWTGANSLVCESQDTSIANITELASGRYYLTITDIHGCENNDSVDIEILPLPIANLDDSVHICFGQTANLDAGNIGASYIWNNNSPDMINQVSTSGLYTVTITNNSCSIIDSTIVIVTNSVVLDLGNDTAICEGTNLELNAGNSGSTYLWNNGNNEMINQVSTNGEYSVLVTTSDGCEGRDTINISINPLPIVDLGNDTSFCDGDSIVLNGTYFFKGLIISKLSIYYANM